MYKYLPGLNNIEKRILVPRSAPVSSRQLIFKLAQIIITSALKSWGHIPKANQFYSILTNKIVRIMMFFKNFSLKLRLVPVKEKKVIHKSSQPL